MNECEPGFMLFCEIHREFGIREQGVGAHAIRWAPRNADVGMHTKMEDADFQRGRDGT
jgi:hypothetical protein